MQIFQIWSSQANESGCGTEAPPTCFLSQSEESHLKGRRDKTACFRQRWMHRGLAQENCEPRSATLKAKKREKINKIELEVSRINPFRGGFFVKKNAVLCRYSAYVFVLMG